MQPIFLEPSLSLMPFPWPAVSAWRLLLQHAAFALEHGLPCRTQPKLAAELHHRSGAVRPKQSGGLMTEVVVGCKHDSVSLGISDCITGCVT
jgi:hypothetical protein